MGRCRRPVNSSMQEAAGLAADSLRTVAAEPTLLGGAAFAAIVLIRRALGPRPTRGHSGVFTAGVLALGRGTGMPMRNGTARLSRLLLAAFALGAAATPLAAQRAALGSAGAEANRPPWMPFFAGSLALAGIPEPFASSCMGGGQRGAGVQADIGVRSAGGWDFRARYTGIREVAIEECVPVVPTRPDGVHWRRTYEDDLWGEGIRTLDLQAGFAPPPLPFLRIAAGIGIEADRGVPLLLGGAGLRLGSRVQFVAGADVLLFRTPFILIEEEWRDSRVVRSSQVDEGEVWRRAWVFRFGAELPIRLQ